MFLRFIETIAVLLAIAFILSQIFLPLAMGRKLFPAFRKTRNVIENEIRELQEQLDEKQLKEHLEELRVKLNPPVPPTGTVQK